jgi:hypothetical protein
MKKIKVIEVPASTYMKNCADCYHMRGKLKIHRTTGRFMFRHFHPECKKNLLTKFDGVTAKSFRYVNEKVTFKSWDIAETCVGYESMVD